MHCDWKKKCTHDVGDSDQHGFFLEGDDLSSLWSSRVRGCNFCESGDRSPHSKVISSLRQLRVSVLRQSASDRAAARLPDPAQPFQVRRYSIDHDGVLQRTREYGCYRRASRTTPGRYLQRLRQIVFRTASPIDFRHHAMTSCTCEQWPSWRVRVPDSRALQPQTLSVVVV